MVEKMPNILYRFFHCEEDKAVNLEKHSFHFAEEMQKVRSVVIKTVPLQGIVIYRRKHVLYIKHYSQWYIKSCYFDI